LNESFNNEDVKIALYDFDEVGNFKESFFGEKFWRLGLIRCVDSSLFDIIDDELFRLLNKRINIKDHRSAKIRLQQIELDNQIYDYYNRNNITNVTSIVLNVDSLVFEGYEERDVAKLKQISVDLVNYINTILDRNKDDVSLSLKMKRCVQIEIDELNGNQLYESLDEDESTYFDIIIEELTRIGVIFNNISTQNCMSDPILQI
jgi:hypothetical protein